MQTIWRQKTAFERIAKLTVWSIPIPVARCRGFPQCKARRPAFTLVEILVVVAVIGVLILLLFPAIQAARESARRTQCLNNLRQFGLGVINHQSASGRFPPGWTPGGSWSAHARILDYLERGVIEDNIKYETSYNTTMFQGRRLSGLRVGIFYCPSERNTMQRVDATGNPIHSGSNYAVNMGEWLVWDPAASTGGSGPFFPNSWLRDRDITDGLSNTFCAAEVKAYTAMETGAAVSGAIPLPATAEDLPPGTPKWGPPVTSNSGHTEWVDAKVHETGFTTTFGPNALVSPARANLRDIDWVNSAEGKSAAARTYAAVTSRSYHSSLVNVVMLDDATTSLSDRVDLSVWRALSTRNGGEAASLNDQ